uniref:Uncharacterized protein n=1 Tax=Timema tahoe TaxID=61484 RepID=A0A7R9IT22_9NEOP|nr:unnamed protein product [Timema tahoe]
MFQKNNVVEPKNRETHLSNFILRQNFVLGVNTKNESTIHNVFSPLAWLSFSMGVFPLGNIDHLKVSIWGGFRCMFGCIWLVAFHSLGIVIVLQFETNIWMRAFLPYVLARRILIIIWCYYYSFLPNLFQTIVSIDNILKKLKYPHFNSYEMRRSGKVSLFIGICCVVLTLMTGMYQRLVFDGLNVYGILVDMTGFLVNCAREVFVITFIFVCYNLSLRFRHVRNLWNVAMKRSALGTFRRELNQNEDGILEEVRLCHFKLCQGVVQMNAVYGLPLATYFCMILLEMLFDLYQFSYMVNTATGVPIIFNTMNTLTIIAVAVVSDKLVHSCNATGDTVATKQQEPPLNRQGIKDE